MFELRVLTGLHQGTALPLIGTEWTIGEGHTCCLILKDSGIHEKHATLIKNENGWELIYEVKSTNYQNEVKHDIPFRLERVWFMITDSNNLWKKFQNDEYVQSKRFNSIDFLGVFLLLASIIVFISWQLADPTHDTSDSLRVLKKENVVALHDSKTEEEILTDMLTFRNLNVRVIKIDNDKKIELHGNLKGDDYKKLKRLLNYLDDNYHFENKVNNNVIEVENELPFKIRQISSSPMPYIITDSGDFLFIGDEILGVKLLSVSSDNISFGGSVDINIGW